MKKALPFLAIAAALAALALLVGGCTSAPASGSAAVSVPSGTERILPYTHIDGFGTPSDQVAWLSWEFEALDFVKYQIDYISCTCRPDSINKQSLLYVEIAKGGTGGKIRKVWFDYWGDSPYMPDGTTREEIETNFMPKLVNTKAADVETLDTMSGATVTTVNLKQILGALLAYHNEKYAAPGLPEAPDYDVDAESGATAAE